MALTKFQLQTLLLCAGQGKRFDPTGTKFKLLATLVDGRSVLETAIAHLQTAKLDPLIVTSPENAYVAKVAQQLHLKHAFTLADYPGMGHSIATGVQASLFADGWLICLGDMPFILPTTFELLHSEIMDHPDKIIAPFFHSQQGHPVYFPKQFAEILLTLKGDQGPKSMLLSDHVRHVRVDDAGILKDVDQPEHLI